MPKNIKLFEDFKASREQLSIPFEEQDMSSESPMLQILAYLQHISLKGQKLGSSQNFNSYLTENNWEEGYKMYLREGHANYYNMYWHFLNTYDLNDEEVWLVDKVKKMVEEDVVGDSEHSIADHFVDHETIEDFLTKNGIKIFEEFKEEQFRNDVEENGLFYALSDCDENGNISIYRSIVYHNDDKGSYFEDAKQYNEVGVYWTYESNLAEPHNGYSGKASALEVTYHAKTNFDSIDMSTTLMVNAWTSKEEKEIRLIEGGLVEIYAIEIGDKVQQIKPIIVKA